MNYTNCPRTNFIEINSREAVKVTLLINYFVFILIILIEKHVLNYPAKKMQKKAKRVES